MPRNTACPRCTRRIARRRKHCLACGADLEELVSQSRRFSRTGAGAIVTCLLAVILLAINFSDRYVPAVAEWYSRMVIGYLPDAELRFAPIPDDERAFYICARAVVKRMGGESSIATFAGSDAATTRSLGDGRYLIESHVDESMEAGAERRHIFRCTLRSDAERWVLEELELEPLARTPTEIAATVR